MGRIVNAATLAGIATTIALGITGCTVPQAEVVRTDVLGSIPSPTPPPQLAPLGTLSGTVVLRHDDQHGGVVYGPYKRASNGIAVDFNCLGVGTATVTVVGVGEFPNQCSGRGSSVRNRLDVHLVDSFIVRVDSPGDVRWSLGVTQVP